MKESAIDLSRRMESCTAYGGSPVLSLGQWQTIREALEAKDKQIAELTAGWGNCQQKMGVYCQAYEEAKSHIAELIHNHRVHAARLIDDRGQLRQRITEMEARAAKLDNDCWTYESTVKKKLLDRAEAAETACAGAAKLLNGGERLARTRAIEILTNLPDAEARTEQQLVGVVPEEPPSEMLPKGVSLSTTSRRGGIFAGWKACRAAMLSTPAPETVKLPAYKFCPAEHAGSQLWYETEQWNHAIEACANAMTAAGIKIAEGE